MLGCDLYFQFIRVTELAAIEAHEFVGRGNEKAADKAAVDSMRSTLNAMDISGHIVIGEGERDKAPMLFTGEKVGKGLLELDIAVDPLEGTTTCASYKEGAMAVIAISERGHMLEAPDVYMDKVAVGPGLPEGVVSIENDIDTNLRNLSRVKGCDVKDITAVILSRDRHSSLIARVRELGARVKLIDDGDIGAVISIIKGECDIYLGIGGAPEGVLSAVALASVGGQICGKLVLDTPELRSRAQKFGISDADKCYTIHDMVRGPAFFVATGITDGKIMNGVRRFNDGKIETDSICFLPGGIVNRITRTLYTNGSVTQ